MKLLFIVGGGIGDAISQTWGYVAAQRAGHEVYVSTTMEPARAVEELWPLIGIRPVRAAQRADFDFDLVTSGSLFRHRWAELSNGWKAKRSVPPRPESEKRGNILLDGLNILTDCGIDWRFPPPPFEGILGERKPKYLGVVCAGSPGKTETEFARWRDLLDCLPAGLPLLFLGAPHVPGPNSFGLVPHEDAAPAILADCIGQTPTLLEVLPLLRLCRAVLSVDTGLGHLAAACGIPTVTLMPERGYESGRSWIPGCLRALCCRHDSSLEHILWAVKEAEGL